MDSFARKLSLAAVLSGAFGVGVTFGFFTPLVSLFMERLGYGSALIGLNAAAGALAILVTGPYATVLASRLGTVRTIVAGTSVAAAAVLMFPLFAAVWALFPLRLLGGAGAALNWIVTETWISTLPPERWRGRVIAIYAVVWGLGLAIGPVLLNFVGTRGAVPFVFCAALLALSCIPAMLVYRYAPAIGRKDQRVRVGYALGIAPVGILAALLAGVAEQSFLGLLPIWGLGIALSTDQAVLLTTLFAVGGVVFMLPLGWLSDRTGRFGLLLAVVCVSTLCTAVLPLLSGHVFLVFAATVVLGGAVAGFYTLGLTLIGQTSAALGADIASLNTVFIMAYTAGAVFGPVIAGSGMDLWPPDGLMVVLTALFASFVPAALWLRRLPAPPAA